MQDRWKHPISTRSSAGCSGACRRVCHWRGGKPLRGAAVAGGRERDAGRVAHQNIGPHLPIHGLRDGFGRLVNEECGVLTNDSVHYG